jgi:micrococcal nuclease
VAPAILVGQVIDVLDGQTILVNLGDRTEAVRYIGISVKESPQPIRPESRGRASLEVNRQLVARQQVRLELDAQERDRDGRLLAYVYVADTMVNAELVRRGAAEVMTVPPNVRHRDLLVSVEQEARDQRRGLWADPEQSTTPQTPAPPLRQATERPGVAPDGTWTCPRAQPIKGNFTPTTGERCTFHMPDGELYGATKPDRCYATDEDARQDGCRRSRR